MADKRKLSPDMIADPTIRAIVRTRIAQLFIDSDIDPRPPDPSDKEAKQLFRDIKDWMVRAEIELGMLQERIVAMGGPRLSDLPEDDTEEDDDAVRH